MVVVVDSVPTVAAAASSGAAASRLVPCSWMSPMSLRMDLWCSLLSSTTARTSSSLYGGIVPFSDWLMSCTSVAALSPKLDMAAGCRPGPRASPMCPRFEKKRVSKKRGSSPRRCLWKKDVGAPRRSERCRRVVCRANLRYYQETSELLYKFRGIAIDAPPRAVSSRNPPGRMRQHPFTFWSSRNPPPRHPSRQPPPPRAYRPPPSP